MTARGSANILELRELIAQKEGRISRERLPSSSLACGIPKAAITEISGTAKIEWVIQFLNENHALKIFWIESEFSLLPSALHQRGLHPSRIVFAEGGTDLFKSIRSALRCQVFECIVSPSAFAEEKMLKALQLLSEKSGASVILLGETLRSSWPISVQFEVNRGPKSRGFQIELKKNKGSQDFSEGQS